MIGTQNPKFIPEEKYEYTYDDSGRSTEILQYYHGNYYYLYRKWEYSYDNNSNLKTRIEYNIPLTQTERHSLNHMKKLSGLLEILKM